MNKETRRKIEKNGFIFAGIIAGAALITWTGKVLAQFLSIQLLFGIDVSTILGAALIYLMLRYISNKI